MQAAENPEFVTPTARLLPPRGRALSEYEARVRMRFWTRLMPPDQPHGLGAGVHPPEADRPGHMWA